MQRQQLSRWAQRTMTTIQNSISEEQQIKTVVYGSSMVAEQRSVHGGAKGSDGEDAAHEPPVVKQEIPSNDGCEGSDGANAVHEPTISNRLWAIEQKLEVLVRHFVKEAPVRPRRQAEEVEDEGAGSDDSDGMTLEEAASSGRPISLRMTRWRQDRAFGFATTQGVDVLVHQSCIRGPIDGLVGQRVIATVLKDPAHSEMSFRAKEVWRERDFAERRMKIKAEKLAAEATRRARLTVKVTEEAQKTLEDALLAERLNSISYELPPGLV